MLSDETSSDSDSGIRFKTQSTRSAKDPRGSDRPPRRDGRDRPGDRRFVAGRHDRERDRGRHGNGGRMHREVEAQRSREREDMSRRMDRRHHLRDPRPDDRERRSHDRSRELERRREAPRSHEKREPERRRSTNRDKPRRITPDVDRSRSGHRQDRPRLQEAFGRDFRAEIRKNIASNNKDGRQSEKSDKHRPDISTRAERRERPDAETRRSLSSSVSHRGNRDVTREEKTRSTQPERISHSSSKDPSRRRSPSLIRVASKERSSLRENTRERERIPPKTECVKSHKLTVAKSPVRSKHQKREVVVEKASSEKGSSLDAHHSKSSSEREEQPTSYYNIIPSVDTVKAVEEPLSISDSSEDEATLRAKLLHLEKELKKTKKKKDVKKKPKKPKKSKKSKSSDREPSPLEQSVSSTTDIKVNDIEKTTSSGALSQIGSEVITTSTETKKKAGMHEEGELSSDTDNSHIEINESDLRHRLRKSGQHETDDEQLKSVSGPALPPHMQAAAVEGPALPPHLSASRSKNIGPTLPSDLRKVLAETEQTTAHDESSSASSEDGIGPLPTGAESRWTDAHESLERRALQMKMNKLDGSGAANEATEREEWMLELPDAKSKIIGIEARQFRSKEGPDMSDRSSWTDTPQDKALKAAGVRTSKKQEATTETLKEDGRQTFIQGRDQQQEKAVKKHKKKHKREESLLELHQKKLKKKKRKEEKESDGVKVRRPFDRDVDLQANRFDDAKKQALIKKAQHLDTRFSRGEAKYL